jgi:hypothetical protein
MGINLINNLQQKVMKTLKSMLAGIIILFTSVAASNAAVKHGQPSQNDVVNIYVNAISTGNADDLDKFLENDMQFNVHQGNNVNAINKDQLLSYLKNNTSNTPVNTNVTVMQQDDSSAKIKVDFKYAGYTRTDVVTLDKTFGWKITSVDSTSK